jgi:ATP-dependent Clp protease protease subunit
MSDIEATSEVYGVFCGAINPDTAKSIAGTLAAATRDSKKRFHVLFQSTGGLIVDGIFLYELFRSLPNELYLYNAGQVASNAAIAFLGATKRFMTDSATFMFHRSQYNSQASTVEQLGVYVASLDNYNATLEMILKRHLNLSDDQWNTHKTLDLNLNVREAIQCGAADEVRNFAPPKGSQIYML